MTAPDTSSVQDVVVVAAADRADDWCDVIERSPRLRLATLVDADGVERALQNNPDAAYAVDLQPRAALQCATTMAEHGRRAVVRPPLHEGIRAASLGGGAEGVEVAHTWVGLAGREAAARLLTRMGRGRISIETAGTPQGSVDPRSSLLESLALLWSLVGDANVTSATTEPGAKWTLQAETLDGRWRVDLAVAAHGSRLAVRAESEPSMVWSCEDGSERLVVGEREARLPRVPMKFTERALASLLAEPTGIDLRAERAIAGLLQRVVDRLPSGLASSPVPLRESLRIAREAPEDALRRIGLRGETSFSASGLGPLQISPPAEPFELWAFRAGLKPVVFLTVEPNEVERTLQFFGDAHCERRQRQVRVGAQDRWDDRRDRGEPRVELYISSDPALARRACHLQSEVDPSRAIRELGELVGYPECCVEAFAAQDDRSNNSLNRYHSFSRTRLADGEALPWQLNNLHTMLAPFYPCSYRCERAHAWVDAALAELERERPQAVADLQAVLARPVLYFEHDHQVVLDGQADGVGVSYTGAAAPGPVSDSFARLVAAIASGDRVVFDDRQLAVESRGRLVASYLRVDPGLGVLAPFA